MSFVDTFGDILSLNINKDGQGPNENFPLLKLDLHIFLILPARLFYDLLKSKQDLQVSDRSMKTIRTTGLK